MRRREKMGHPTENYDEVGLTKLKEVAKEIKKLRLSPRALAYGHS
jgi:hypothetical protein